MDEEMGIRERLAGSIWAVWIKPVFDYITRVAELIVLSAAFRVAADNTDNLLLDIMSAALAFVCTAYAGVTLAVFLFLVDKVQTRKLWVALLVALPCAVAMAFGSFEGSKVLSEAIEQIASLDAS